MLAIRGWVAGCILAAALAANLDARASFIDTSGREWRALTETTGLSWNQVRTVCPVDGLPCAGTVGGIDFTDWIWANGADILSLFIGTFGIPIVPADNGVSQIGSTWATPFVNAFGITSTASDSYGHFLQASTGWAAAVLTGDWAPIPYVYDWTGDLADIATINVATSPAQANSGIGVWLYRPTDPQSNVPEPGSCPMLLAGLGLLGWALRRGGNVRQH